ncbi:MAG: DUF4962 domain-containing protein [Prolixibacteraceae bacterium]
MKVPAGISSNRASLLCLFFTLVTFSLNGVFGQQEKLSTNLYPVMHPNFREWSTPALGMTVKFNPTPLLWPAVKGKNASYEVRLSTDSTFQSRETLGQQGIKWAIWHPHRKLAPGKWYWQFRNRSDSWSELNNFVVPAKAIDFNAPAAEKLLAAIPGSHPRVLLDAASLNKFRKEAPGTTEAKSILAEADKNLPLPLPKESQAQRTIEGETPDQNKKLAQLASQTFSNKVYSTIDTDCKAYLITGDEKYASQAIGWGMEAAAWDPKGVTLLSDFGDARCMLAMANVFDTFNGQLSAGQKTKLVGAIKARAERIYKSWINYTDPKILSSHVWQHILNYFLESSIAVYGETPEAADWISYAYELWMCRAPILGADDGDWVIGLSYFRLNMETLLNIPMIIKNYTGFDFIRQHPWYQLNPSWLVYALPPGSSGDGFGDNSELLFSPGEEFLAWSDALGKLSGNGMAAWYARQIAEKEKITVANSEMLQWFRLRYLRGMKAPGAESPEHWSQSKIFPGNGLVELHTDLTNVPNDLFVSMRSSPFGSYGHMLADQNTFNIVAGGKRLFFRSGYKVAMDDPHRLLWYKHTRGQNGILIDNQGQPFDVESYGYIARFLEGNALSYAVGDATSAYKSATQNQDAGLKKFRRHLLLLKPDILVVYDELEAQKDVSWSWLIHSPQHIDIDSTRNAFSCSNGMVNSMTNFYTSQPVKWSMTNIFTPPLTNWTQKRDDEGNLVHYENDQWHVTASTAEKSKSVRFLSIFRMTKNGLLPGKAEDVIDIKNEYRVGEWTIKAELDTAKSPLLEASRQDQQVFFTSSAPALLLKGKKYQGKTEGSSKLAEMIKGKRAFSEANDQLPEVTREIPDNITLAKPLKKNNSNEE